MDKTWEREPDFKVFTHNGIKCRIERQHTMKYLMGYIILDRHHPWFNADPAELSHVKVHGGVSWTGDNPFITWDTPDEFWIGFYCGHAFDLIPYFWEQDYHDHPKLFKNDVYRSFSYVEHELKKLADQASTSKKAMEIMVDAANRGQLFAE